MADDPKYSYSQPNPKPSKEVLDLTKQMLEALREMQSIESSSADQKLLQRDLTQEELRNYIKENQPDVDLSFDYEDKRGNLKKVLIPLSINFFWPDAGI